MQSSFPLAIQLIRDLMAYDVQPELLNGLVSLLKPSRPETVKIQAKTQEGKISKH